MTKVHHHIRIEQDSDLENWLQSKNNVEPFIRETLEQVRTGKLGEIMEHESKQQIELEYKKLRNEKLKLDIKIKEKELSYYDTFHKAPSSEAKEAMKDKAFRELKEDEINLIVKLITLENVFDGCRITCLECKIQVTYKDRLEALNEAARHLSAVHGKKILSK